MLPERGKNAMVHYLTLLLLTFVVFVKVMTARPQQPIPGIGPEGAIIRAQKGFRDAKGLTVDPQWNVYFSDVLLNRIYKVDTQGQLSTFMEATEGIVGMMFDRGGRLIARQGALGRLIAIDVNTKAVTVLANQYEGRAFNEPHDLIVDRRGWRPLDTGSVRPAILSPAC